MPLIKHTSTSNQSIVAIWEISESLEELKMLADIHTMDEEVEAFSEDRGIEWFAARVALKSLLGDINNVCKDEFGKPIVKEGANSGIHISLSHCSKYAVAMAGMNSVGVDIEEVSERIERISKRFMAKDEWNFVREESKLQDLFLIWCAKEALYKLYGKKAVDFASDMEVISPFDSEDQQFKILFSKYEDEISAYTANYEIIDNHCLVWIDQQ